MPNSRPPLVMIAVDDQAVCDALQFALQLEGLSVHTHPGGSGLLADRDLSLAACVILDDRKPHLDGFELLQRLRASNIRIPVILLTSHATSSLQKRAAGAGIQMVLEKPLLNNVLADSIRTVLGSSWATGHSRNLGEAPQTARRSGQG
jgi:two-component system, LuxR family, response regulator FixJ